MSVRTTQTRSPTGAAGPDEDDVPSQVGIGVERAIAGSLRAGVALAFGLVAAGLVLGYVNGTYAGGSRRAGTLIGPRSQAPHDLSGIATGLVHGQADAWIALGLLVLVITPIVRVAVSIVGFAHLRDRTYTIITAVVLTLLAASFFVGGTS